MSEPSSIPAVDDLGLRWVRRRPRGVHALALGVVALVTVVAVADILLASHLRNALTTYAASSTLTGAADLLAGLSLVVAGIVTLLSSRREQVAILAALAGMAWFAPDWVGWHDGPALLRSVGMVVAPFVPVLLFHLALASFGTRPWRPAMRVVVALYVVTSAVAVGLALFRDPFLDRYCWSNCTDNVFLVHAEPAVARGLRALFLVSVMVGAAAVAAASVLRIARASPVSRRAALLLVTASVLVAVAQGGYAGQLLRDPEEIPDDAVFEALFLARAGSTALLAFAVGWTAYLVWRTRSAVARLATQLGEAPAPGSLRTVLAAALGDPELEVAYPVGADGCYVGADGGEIALVDAGPGRALTSIVREGRQIAVVVHSSGIATDEDLERSVGSAARLAVENERLQAELLAQLRELRASRARIVESGDDARCALERDLHDGAQQRLLALTYELRLAVAAARADDAPELAGDLVGAVEDAEGALEELRELAHGIYPAILTEAGLGPALLGLVDRAPVPVELAYASGDRYAPAVEMTAYVVVEDAISDAVRRNASHVVVRSENAGAVAVFEVEDDGAGASSPPPHLADRVGAVGGRVERTGRVLRAELPCAS